MSVSVDPMRPSSVEPMTASFQVVMLSASLKLICARPCLSVSMEGCQSNVSGKYSRSRGVDNWRAPELPKALKFPVDIDQTLLETEEDSVTKENDSTNTSTV